MAFPVGTKTNRAAHKYKNAGSGPNATPMYA